MNQLHPDQAFAALAHATSLQERFLRRQNPQIAQNSPQNAPEQENEGKAQKIPEKSDEGFKTQVLDELSTLKAEVEQLLQEEEEEEKEEEKEPKDDKKEELVEGKEETNETGKEE